MWVVKIGGSLTDDVTLAKWLELLAQLGSGRVTIVPGGGTLADEVRRLQTQWQFDDLTAHNMALLAMCQTGHLMQAVQPTLYPVSHEHQIAGALRRGKTVLWHPLALLQGEPDATTNWDHTSDSLALLLAARLNAERLIIVKRVEAQGRGVQQLCEDGVLDAGFARAAQRASFPLHVLGCRQHMVMRQLLQGQPVAALPA